MFANPRRLAKYVGVGSMRERCVNRCEVMLNARRFICNASRTDRRHETIAAPGYVVRTLAVSSSSRSTFLSSAPCAQTPPLRATRSPRDESVRDGCYRFGLEDRMRRSTSVNGSRSPHGAVASVFRAAQNRTRTSAPITRPLFNGEKVGSGRPAPAPKAGELGRIVSAPNVVSSSKLAA